jgi:hypothetical protein
VEWAGRLAGGTGFDPSTERLIEVAVLVDTIYERSRLPDDGINREPAEDEPGLVPTEAGVS